VAPWVALTQETSYLIGVLCPYKGYVVTSIHDYPHEVRSERQNHR
jgi:hypothetical protein